MKTVTLNIPGLLLRLDLSETTDRLLRGVEEMFGPFVAADTGSPDETLDVVPLSGRFPRRPPPETVDFVRESLMGPLSRFPFSPDPDREAARTMRRIKPLLANDRFREFLKGFESPADVVLYPLKRGGIVLGLSPPGAALFLDARAARRTRLTCIYAAVYFITAAALPLRNGLLLHGAGIRNRGRGCLFLGLSGEGKSTIAGFSDPGAVVSDDAVIVRQTDTGYAMARAPFDQHCPDTAGTSGGGGHDVRIDAGFFLKQDQRVYLEPVSPPEACALILRHHIHYFRYFPRDRVKRAFRRVTGLCRQAPFFRLHFKKEPSFWPLVEKEMDKHS